MIKDNIAKLNQRITIQKITEKQDKNGNDCIEAADFLTCWAEVKELYGDEYWAAQAVGQQNTIIFKVRYNSKIAELNNFDYRILHKNEIYDIKQVDTMQNSRRFWKIKAVQNERLRN